MRVVGPNTREHGRSNPPGLIRLNADWVQSLSQDVPDTSGPAGAFTFPCRQLHFERLRQQDEVNERAARGASEANDRNNTRDAATMLRVRQELFLVSSIPWSITIPRTG